MRINLSSSGHYHVFPLSPVVVLVVAKSAVHLYGGLILPDDTLVRHDVHSTNRSCGRITEFWKLKLLSKWDRKVIRRSGEVVLVDGRA